MRTRGSSSASGSSLGERTLRPWPRTAFAPRIDSARRAASKTVTLDSMRAALELEPTRTEWRLAYTRALDLEGRTAEAAAELEEATYRDPRWTRHRYLDELPAGLLPLFLPLAERGFRRA